MPVVILANLPALSEAADHLQGAGGAPSGGGPLPDLGDGDANEALGGFATVVDEHRSRLAEAAGNGARSMRNYVAVFRKAGD